MVQEPDLIERILQHCLEEIQNGNETLESVIAQFPDHAEILRSELEMALWLQDRGDSLNPRPGFQTASRARLMRRIAQPPQNWFQRLFAAVSGWFSGAKAVPRAALASGLVMIFLAMVIVGGNAVSAAISHALPGDPFYSLKLTLERAALTFNTEPTEEARLVTEFTERRLTEVKRLVIEGRYDEIPESVVSLESQVQSAIQILDDMASEEPSQAGELATSLEGVLAAQDRLFAVLITSVPNSQRTPLARAAEVSKKGARAAHEIAVARPGPAVSAVLATATRPVPSPTSRPPQPTATRRVLPTSAPTRTARAAVPTATPIPTLQPVFEPTATDTRVPTRVPPTDTPVPTSTPTPLPTNTSTRTPTDTPTRTPTDTPTRTPTDTPTRTPEPTDTPTPEPTDTPTRTPSPTDAPTRTPVPTSTDTPTPEPTEPFFVFPTWTPPTYGPPDPTDTPAPPLTQTPVDPLKATPDFVTPPPTGLP